MAFSVGSYGISLSGDMNFNDASCNIINNKDNKLSFVEQAGAIGSIFTCHTSVATLSTNAVNVLQINRSSGAWGGCYIECIISGVHNNNVGFSNKWECMLRTSDTAGTFANAIIQGSTTVSSGSNLTVLTIGTNSATIIPSLRHTTSGTTTTFSVIPPNADSGGYIVFFRIMNGSTTTYNYTVY